MKSTFVSPIRLLVVIGVRPQYIKAVALKKLIATYNANSEHRIELEFVDTAQHYSDNLRPEYLSPLPLKIDYRFRHSSVDPFSILTNSISQLGDYIRLRRKKINGLVVFGDANPTLVGALVAAKLDIPLIHIEAGARRDGIEQEEKNRRIADCMANVRFCVTHRAVETLEKEGLHRHNILTGDLWYPYLIEVASLESKWSDQKRRDGYVLVTMHRPQNLRKELISEVVDGLARLDRRVRWIVHPRSEKMIKGLCRSRSIFEIHNPLSYGEMVRSILESDYVITDSGGLIRESHHLKRRVLVRRDEGGWGELIETGYNYRMGCSGKEVDAAIAWAEGVYAQPYPSGSPLRFNGGIKRAIKTLAKISHRL